MRVGIHLDALINLGEPPENTSSKPRLKKGFLDIEGAHLLFGQHGNLPRDFVASPRFYFELCCFRLSVPDLVRFTRRSHRNVICLPWRIRVILFHVVFSP